MLQLNSTTRGHLKFLTLLQESKVEPRTSVNNRYPTSVGGLTGFYLSALICKQYVGMHAFNYIHAVYNFDPLTH